VLRILLVEQHGELAAADPEGSSRRNHPAKTSPDLTDQQVPRRVAEIFVDAFQMVDIEEEKTQLPGSARSLGEGPFKARPIAEPAQHIDVGELVIFRANLLAIEQDRREFRAFGDDPLFLRARPAAVSIIEAERADHALVAT
jgi:hypothetical protein